MGRRTGARGNFPNAPMIVVFIVVLGTLAISMVARSESKAARTAVLKAEGRLSQLSSLSTSVVNAQGSLESRLADLERTNLVSIPFLFMWIPLNAKAGEGGSKRGGSGVGKEKGAGKAGRMRALVDGSCECPLCGSHHYSFYATENGFNLVKCGECGVVFLCPMPPPEEVSEAARTGEHKTGAFKGWRDYQLSSFKERIPHFFSSEELEGIGTWLDVGAGCGELLYTLRSLEGGGSIALEGVEPCLPKLDIAREHGIEITNHTLEQLASVGKRYDVISLMNIVSHLPDPVSFFKSLGDLLTEDGCLWVCTGNMGEIPASEDTSFYYLPDHLLFVGRQHLVELLRAAGLPKIKLLAYRYFYYKGERAPHNPGFRALFAKACHGDEDSYEEKDMD